jgi:copper chaperone NosL
MTLTRIALIGALAALVAACGSEQTAEAPPEPVELTDEATGHYCGMLLESHEGPKGQIHLTRYIHPIWFSSVRDAVAFTRLPEEPKDIIAIYVNDMGRATNWANPEPGTWVEAREAWFVIESERRGGMGAPEAVPFSAEELAKAFQESHGGRLVRFDDIPDDYVLGPVELDAHGMHSAEPDRAAGPTHTAHSSHQKVQ